MACKPYCYRPFSFVCQPITSVPFPVCIFAPAIFISILNPYKLKGFFAFRKIIAVAVLAVPVCLHAQDNNQSYWHIKGNGSLYFSWGYNMEWYTHSNVHIKQDALGNDYTMEHVSAQDRPGWDHDLFKKDLTIPQYNYRLGYFFNKKQDLAFEINFDHTKYIIRDGQDIHIKGTLNGNPVDQHIYFSDSNGFHYYLNNGANFLLFNLVKRFRFYQNSSNNIKIDGLAKAGIGPLFPHVDNLLFGKRNDPDFQFGGWNAGIETAVRATFMKYAYLEFSQKVDYARYSHLHLYQGNGHQAFGTYELILSLGITLPTGKHNPEFHRGIAMQEENMSPATSDYIQH